MKTLDALLESCIIDEPVISDDFEVYPIIGASSVRLLGFKEAESLGTAWIQEAKHETVSMLEAVNTNQVGVLVPFLTQVKGGKQDRTVFEPIIIPVGCDGSNPLPIPARCLEQGRWGYRDDVGMRTSRRFESISARASGQMAYSFMADDSQSQVWAEVRSLYSQPQTRLFHSPTRSLVSTSRKMFEHSREMKGIENRLSEGLHVSGQVGILVAYRENILGVDLYGASNVWTSYANESLRGFLFDKIILGSYLERGKEDGRTCFVDEFQGLELEEEAAVGSGSLFRIHGVNWKGMCLAIDTIPAHVYAVKKQRWTRMAENM